MTDHNAYAARAVRGRSIFWFHESGYSDQTEYFNLQIGACSAELLGRIEALRYMGNEVTLDWGSRVVRHPAHFDPLYLWEEGGSWWLEVEAHVLPSERALPAVILRVGGRVLTAPVLQKVDSPHDWGDLQSTLGAASDRSQSGWTVDVRASSEIEVVWQSIVKGQAVETREVLSSGLHSVWVPDTGSDYLGLSISQRLPGGAEMEHKHIFRGALHD